MRDEAKNLAGRLTTDEKLCLIKGLGTWNTFPVERLGLPSVMMSDGPHGLRKQEDSAGDHLGLGGSIKTVCFPTASGTAASFSRALLRELGEVLGGECRANKLALLLGPAVNIKRSPLCGRNFEYFSEDPYLAAEMSVSYTQGLQSRGVGVSIKHFAANNQEKRRMTVQSVVDERAMREIYLPAFEQTVKRADPWTVMCAYNRLFEGIYCSENKRLLTDILREEWGFGGVVVSDWGAVSNRVAGVPAGLDLEMPDSADFHRQPLLDALRSGELEEAALDEACARVINLVLRAMEGAAEGEVPPADNELDHILARQYARETMVLLKNENAALPLKKEIKAAFIGGFAKQPRFQGGGSSHVNAFKVTSAYETASALGLPVEYAEGFGVRDYEYDPVKTKQAVALAAQCDVAVIFAGLPEAMDSEGADRKHLDLPPCQNTVIQAIVQAQPNTIVVLCNGAPVRMPWAGDVGAILESYLAGEAVGEAQIDLLYGDYSPSAKLAETFPLRLQDTPCYGNFPGGTATVEYRESVYVGYRYYDKAGKDVLFPFGHGLTYTQFEYSNLKLARKNFSPGENLEVTATIKNTGDVDAAEIVQFYVEAPQDGAFRPKMELKGFEKIFLKAGEKRRVSCTLDARSFAYWHTGLNDWYCAPGEYAVLAAASSRDVKLRAPVSVHNFKAADSPYAGLALPSYESGLVHQVSAEEFEAVLGAPLPPMNHPIPRRLGLDANLEDAQQSKFGRVISKIIGMAMPVLSKAAGDSLGDVTGIMEMIYELPMRTIGQFSFGFLDRPMAEAIISIFNEENYCQSIWELCKGAGRIVKKVAGMGK